MYVDENYINVSTGIANLYIGNGKIRLLAYKCI